MVNAMGILVLSFLALTGCLSLHKSHSPGECFVGNSELVVIAKVGMYSYMYNSKQDPLKYYVVTFNDFDQLYPSQIDCPEEMGLK